MKNNKGVEELKTTWGARLDEELHQRARAIVRSEDMTKTDLVIEAVKHYVGQKERELANLILVREDSESLPTMLAMRITQGQQEARRDIESIKVEAVSANKAMHEVMKRVNLIEDLLLHLLLPREIKPLLQAHGKDSRRKLNDNDINSAAVALLVRFGLRRAGRIMGLAAELCRRHQNDVGSPDSSTEVTTDSVIKSNQ